MFILSTNHLKLLLPAVYLAAAACLGMSAMRFEQVLHEKSSVEIVAQVPMAKVGPPLPDMQAIARMGWFGVSKEERMANGQMASVNLNAQFELRGISHSRDTKYVGAYIAQKGQPELYYRVGDALAGNAGKVEEIFSDHVTVSQGASDAELYFPGAQKH